MDEDVLADHLVDDPIGLEVNFPVIGYTDTVQFGREMFPQGQSGKVRAERFQLLQHVSGLLRRVVGRNMAVDVNHILLCIVG